MTNDYELLGSVLRSDIDLPELRAATAGSVPAWTVERVDSLPPLAPDALLRCVEISETLTVTLSLEPDGWRIGFTDTGEFSITDDGTRIRWAAAAHADESLARTDLLGRVLALALHQGDTLALHGSGVAFDDGVIVFLAPKFHGKSTTALALVDAGARLAGDDIIAVRPGEPPTVLPGVASARLWPNSAERLALVREARITDADQPKIALEGIPAARMLDTELPLLACYLLVPQQEEGGEVRRIEVSGLQAPLALAGQAKIGALMSGPLTARLLDLSARIAAHVPVYRLSVPRGLDRLPDLVNRLFNWHGATCAQAQ